MKNDILLFAVMFAVAWIGFTVAKDHFAPTAIISQNTVANDATPDSASAAAVDQRSAEKKIEQVLMSQMRAWNQGDLYGFMDAYWSDEALTISSGGDVTLGWGATYANYRQKYPEGKMGTIEFKDLKTEMVGKESAIVTGRFDHQLADREVNGNFSLVLKIIDRKWKIVNDHTYVTKQ